MTQTTVTMHIGDVRDVMARLIDGGDTYDQLVTSPPFLALRSYLPAGHPDKDREIGSEPTPAAFLDTLYGLTAQAGELVADWGSICVELGDTMSGSGGAGGDYDRGGMRSGQPKFRHGYVRNDRPNRPAQDDPKDQRQVRPPRNGRGSGRDWAENPANPKRHNPGPGWPLEKSMCLLPHAYTIGLAYGHNPLTGTPTAAGRWRVRNVICWARPNPPVGSLGKRNPHARTGDQKFRPATSYITVACRGTGRYFDLDAVRAAPTAAVREVKVGEASASKGVSGGDSGNPDKRRLSHNPAGAPPLDWHTDELDGDWLWRLPTAPYKGSHYATFPLTLPRRLILAMCPERVCQTCGWPSERVVEHHRTFDKVGPSAGRSEARTIGAGPMGATYDVTRDTLGWTDCGHDAWRTGHALDPFGGSGTTAVAAALEHRDATLIDLDARNIDLVRRRLNDTLRIVNEQRDGNTIVWTVEAALPAQREQVVGQASIFDLEDTA